MGKTVFAAGAAHLTAQARDLDAAGADAMRIDASWEELRTAFESARPDALVVFGTDHFQSFFYDLMPAFTIGVGTHCKGWGDGGVAPSKLDSYRVPVHQELARTLAAELMREGFDPTWSEELKLDHSFNTPIQLLSPNLDVPVVPIVVNVVAEPRPSFKRCYEFGQAVGRIVARTSDLRVAVIGTGGLSHEVGSPGYGRVNPEMDTQFLDLLAAGRAEDVTGWSEAWVAEAGGNGMNEIRAWLAMSGTVAGARGRVLVYAQIPAWGEGLGMLQYDLAA